jgi:uncharacterized OB-fold protein
MKRPTPMPTLETGPFWDAARQGELRLPRCRRCATIYYPPPPRCPRCLDSELQWELMSGQARILSWTKVHLDTVPGVTPPFTIAEAELVEQPGLVLVAHVASSEDLSAGLIVAIGFTEFDGEASFPELTVAGDQRRAGSAPGARAIAERR